MNKIIYTETWVTRYLANKLMCGSRAVKFVGKRRISRGFPM